MKIHAAIMDEVSIVEDNKIQINLLSIVEIEELKELMSKSKNKVVTFEVK